MTRSIVAALGLTIFGLGLAGCGSEATEAVWSKEAAQYAVYATQIPLYPGTKIEDAMGAEHCGIDLSNCTYSMTWWSTAKATRDELRIWYEQKLQTAQRQTTEDGHFVLTVVPKGAAPREDMGIRIEEDGKYRVFEHTLQKKPGT